MASSPWSNSLFGPELYWVLVTASMKWVGMRNSPPTGERSAWLEQFWYWLPFVAVPLSFVALWNSGVPRGWMLLRIALSAGVGVCLASYVLTTHIDFRNSRNSGVPMGWILSTGLGWGVTALGALITGAVIWWRNRT